MTTDGARSASILFIVKGDEAFGSWTSVFNLATGLREYGCDVSFLTIRSGPLLQKLEAVGFRITELGIAAPPTPDGRGLAFIGNVTSIFFWTFTSARVLRNHVKVSNANIVHVQWINLLPLVVVATRKLSPIIVWEALNIVKRSWTRGFLRLCQLVGVKEIANSHFVADTIGGRVKTMHLSADLKTFAYAPMRQNLAGSGRLRAVCLSRLDPSKGHAEIIRGLSRSSHAANYLIFMIDDKRNPSYRIALEKLAEQLDVRASIEFIDQTDCPESVLRAVDFSISMRVDPEPFGLSIVESLAVGRPVLAHSLGGPSETVSPLTGWLVDDVLPDTVGGAFDRIWQERRQMFEMSERARAHAENRFSRQIQTNRYIEIVLGVQQNRIDLSNT